MYPSRRRALLLPFVLLFGAGCDSSVADPELDGVPEGALRFVEFADSAPPLTDTVVTFWAVRGDDREIEIGLAPTIAGDDPEDFLVFEVPSGALTRYPDGRPFARGDSVQITLTVIDPARFVFLFEPAGLVFSQETPARLEVSYEWARKDDDRDIDQEDSFGFWRQERVGALWYRVATVTIKDLEEAEARIFGFTRYALASN